MKVKIVPVPKNHVIKVYWGRTSKAPRILNLGTIDGGEWSG